MPLEVVLRHVPEADLLGQGGGVHVLGLLGHHHPLHEAAFRHQEANPQGGGHGLGKAAGEDHPAVGVHALEGRQKGALIPELAVGVVLQDHQIVPLGKGVDLFPLFQRCGEARGILEVGDDIDELCLGVRLDLLLQIRHVHPVRLHLHPHQLGPIGAEGIEHAHEGKLLTEDRIPLVEQHLAGQVRRLLAAGDGDELVPLLGKTVLPLEIALEGVTQGRKTFGEPVLEHGRAPMEQRVVGDGRHLGGGEGIGGRVAAGKADHVRGRRHLEQLTDDRTGYTAHAV